MFLNASAFDQPLLYCNWNSQNSKLKEDGSDVCDGTVTCGWGDETCPPTIAPTPSPIAPTPSPTAAPTGNGGGGKVAAICFLY